MTNSVGVEPKLLFNSYGVERKGVSVLSIPPVAPAAIQLEALRAYNT